jgi:hypothetical protein
MVKLETRLSTILFAFSLFSLGCNLLLFGQQGYRDANWKCDDDDCENGKKFHNSLLMLGGIVSWMMCITVVCCLRSKCCEETIHPVEEGKEEYY